MKLEELEVLLVGGGKVALEKLTAVLHMHPGHLLPLLQLK
ncbi:MAG: hypothetical protein WDM78_00785 [Puia sp.]